MVVTCSDPWDCLWDGVHSWHHPHLRGRVALVPLEVHEMRVQVPGRVLLEYAAQKRVAVQLVRLAFLLLAIVDDEATVVCDALDLEQDLAEIALHFDAESRRTHRGVFVLRVDHSDWHSLR